MRRIWVAIYVHDSARVTVVSDLGLADVCLKFIRNSRVVYSPLLRSWHVLFRRTRTLLRGLVHTANDVSTISDQTFANILEVLLPVGQYSTVLGN